jgi:carbon-monoxide dehydrogenase large subunit
MTHCPPSSPRSAARAPGAPLLSPLVPGNLCMDWHVGDAAAVDAAFAAAAHVGHVAPRQSSHRHQPDGAARRRRQLTTRDATVTRCTSPARTSTATATSRRAALGVAARQVRFIAPDVGGGFGAKNFAYAEHALILWAAKRVGRPVKWIASRSEVFLSDHQGRDHQAEASLALDADGKFLALRIASVANIGAYMVGSAGGVQTNQYAHLPGTVYAIPAIALRVMTVLTNTTPIGVTRGPGFAEMVNIMERLIDAAARQCGFDRAELRRRNFAAGPHR